MLAKLFGRLGKQSQLSPPADPVNSVSVWRDTGQVYYLENTLKLTYQSKSGAITLEKLSLRNLAEVLSEIDALGTNSPLAPTTLAAQKSAFNISLCAVTWQQKDDSVRVKAIPDAALLRSKTSCFSRSQAIFRHAFLLEHDDLLSPSLHHAKEGVYTYNRISIEEFTQQISDANARLSGKFRQAINVKADNFDTAFTEHETEQIERLIGFGDTNLNKISANDRGR